MKELVSISDEQSRRPATRMNTQSEKRSGQTRTTDTTYRRTGSAAERGGAERKQKLKK